MSPPKSIQGKVATRSRAQSRYIQFPTIATVLTDLAAGELRLATSTSVADTLSRLTNLAPDELKSERIVAIVWDRLPLHTAILDEAIDQLARAALAIWPLWYFAESSVDECESTLGSLTERMQRAGVDQYVLTYWLQLADKACQTKRPPRWPSEFTLEVEARQLALALGEQSCRLVFAVQQSEQDDGALLGLARASEWISRETTMPLLVLVPSDIGNSPALDSINFGMVELHSELIPDAVPVDRDTEFLAQPAQIHERLQRPETVTRSRLIVQPLIGRPHPDSAGEQILWEKLQADPELANLFLCNQWTNTICDTTYLVDFVWRSGKLIVEVDGYYWHSSRYSFAYDRRRDYELQLSGHRVLRLPHDEVIADADGAIDKIRLMVRIQQQT